MIRKEIFLFFGSILLFLFIFKAWLFSPTITSGDFWYYFDSMFNNFSLYPYAWDITVNSRGIGAPGFAYQSGTILSAIVVNFAMFFKLSWETASRIFFYIPYIIISVFSSIFFVKKVFPKNKFWIIAPIIFSINTYILITVGGGQMPTALSYSLIPFSLFLFIRLLDDKVDKDSSYASILISSSLLFSLQCILDLRIAFVTGVAVSAYIIVLLAVGELRVKNLIAVILSFILIALINSYWLIPILLLGVDPIIQLGGAYGSAEMVEFLSFAKVENSIGLLHPYWPENIFGKIGFMKAEFLILPILAFSSLLFIGKEKKESKIILFFALIGLLGIFLGKGASEPFGNFYIWLFENIPGFQLFRDSFKWYVLVAVSYSMLIPFSVWNIYDLLNSKLKTQNSKLQFKIKKFVPNVFVILVIIYLLLLIKPAIIGELGGTLRSRALPSEYALLDKYLSQDHSYFRTLWIPNTILFGHYTNEHPQISGRDFFNEYDQIELLETLGDPRAKEILENSSVKYVIVPLDSEKEIYLTDRKYDERKYSYVIDRLDKIPWLTKDKQFGKIVVYKTQSYRDHFWCECKAEITWRFVNPTKYIVKVLGAQAGDKLIFSEKYDKGWLAKGDNLNENSVQYEKLFNSFSLPEGDSELVIYYSPQDFVNMGLIVSLVTAASLGILAAILVIRIKK